MFCDFGQITTRWGKVALMCCLSLLNEVKWEARCCELARANCF